MRFIVLPWMLISLAFAEICHNDILGLIAKIDPLVKIGARIDRSIEPVFHDRFAFVIGSKDSSQSLYVIRFPDQKIIHEQRLKKTAVIDNLSFNSEKGYVVSRRGDREIEKLRGFRIQVRPREPISYNEVWRHMEINPYDLNNLPTIPIRLFRFFKDRIFDFFVGSRSRAVIVEGTDVRRVGITKPIHPMGIGVSGRVNFFNSQYSGLLQGGSFPVIGRLSISQGNAGKEVAKSWWRRFLGLKAKPQKRSVSMALKVFPTEDLNEKVITANAVFQNDLNGEVLDNFLDGVLTNQPALDIRKIRELYEVFTLVGVARGALQNPNDIMRSSPFINPQIRPIHQLTESGLDDVTQVRTPTWLKFQFDEETAIQVHDDFRVELAATIASKHIRYVIFAGDQLDENGEIIWEEVGEIVFDRSILSEGVDQNVLFHHSSLRSEFTGELITPSTVPVPIRVQ